MDANSIATGPAGEGAARHKRVRAGELALAAERARATPGPASTPRAPRAPRPPTQARSCTSCHQAGPGVAETAAAARRAATFPRGALPAQPALPADAHAHNSLWRRVQLGVRRALHRARVEHCDAEDCDIVHHNGHRLSKVAWHTVQETEGHALKIKGQKTDSAGTGMARWLLSSLWVPSGGADNVFWSPELGPWPGHKLSVD